MSKSFTVRAYQIYSQFKLLLTVSGIGSMGAYLEDCSRWSGWSGFGQTTVSQGKNKMLF